MEHMDIHSWSRPDLVRVRHLELDLDVHFDRRVLQGTCTLHVNRFAGDELVLDTRGLDIHSVENAAGFELGAAHPILGAPLTIQMLPEASWVRIIYSTSPHASGLQWLAPPQTAGKIHPFLYTQSQAIHARSWIPLQDTPAVRATFEAAIRVPAGLRAVMGAEMSDGHFRMQQPIPSYLIALAAGDLEFRALGPR
jgi:leukotriene-A4 hydrolase